MMYPVKIGRLSTAHLSCSTAAFLAHVADYVEYDPVDPLGGEMRRPLGEDENADEVVLMLTVNAVPFGWQIFLGDDKEMLQEKIDASPPDLAAIIKAAAADGYHWLWFDADEDEDDRFPTYDWNDE